MAIQPSFSTRCLSAFGRAKHFVMACVDVVHDARAMQAETARRARFGDMSRSFDRARSGGFRQ